MDSKKAFLSILIISAMTGVCFPYIPFPQDSACWTIKTNSGWCMPETCVYDSHYTNYFLWGDTAISGVVYSKMYRNSRDSLFGFYREDSAKKVLFKGKSPGSVEETVFDFGAGIGDSVRISYNLTIVISDIDTVDYGGKERRRWHINYMGYRFDYWLEGVGSLKGGPLAYLCCIVGISYVLYDFDESGAGCSDSANNIETIFIKPNAVRISPNPFTRSVEITGPSDAPFSVYLYDVKGRIVKQFMDVRDESVVWNAEGRAKGIYLAKIKAGGRQYCRRLILLR